MSRKTVLVLILINIFLFIGLLAGYFLIPGFNRWSIPIILLSIVVETALTSWKGWKNKKH